MIGIVLSKVNFITNYYRFMNRLLVHLLISKRLQIDVAAQLNFIDQSEHDSDECGSCSRRILVNVNIRTPTLKMLISFFRVVESGRIM
jgi:hypothetical protein